MIGKIVFVAIIVLLVGMFAASINVQEVKAQTTVNVTLYGSAINGWGLYPNAITNPGPTLYANQYDYVNLTLYSQDGITHQFFVDYNSNGLIDSGEPASAPFSSNTTFGFNATVSGTFTYRCAFHPTTMLGTIFIRTPVPELPLSQILPIFILATTALSIAYRKKNQRALSS